MTRQPHTNQPGVIDRVMPLAKLAPNPRNPRRHPDEQIERLMASLRADGQTRPLLVRKDNLMLIAGHGVREAALRLGWTDIAVRLLDVDQAAADRIMLGDNRFSDLSSQDDERVAELLREIGAGDWLTAGFSDDEANKLLRSLDQAELTIREVETAAVRDTFWIAVRGPLARQADVLTRIKQLLGEYPEVEVDLGVIDEIAA